MRTFQCVLARREEQIVEAQRLRHQVYAEEGLLPASGGAGERDSDARDEAESTLHFLVYAGGELAGTVRLLGGSRPADRMHTGRIVLDLESKVRLHGFSGQGISAAEVTRFCVLRRHRCTGVTAALFAGLFAESRRRGITHWVAGANMETDVIEDAALAQRILRERGFVHAGFRAEPLALEPVRTPRRRPFYTEEQRLREDRTALPVPRPLSLFARRMGARFIGPPVYDERFQVFALPLVATLAEIAASGGERLRGAEVRRDRTRDLCGAGIGCKVAPP